MLRRAIGQIIGEEVRDMRIGKKSLLASAVLTALAVSPSASFAQDNEIETAKPVDSASPSGVSYISGSYTYSLPLISIGIGEWPHKLVFVLRYDSSGNRYPNKPWTHNLVFRLSEQIVGQLIDENGDSDPETEDVQYNVVLGNQSTSFSKFNSDRTVGAFEQATLRGNKLEYSGQPLPLGGEPHNQTGTFSFTGRQGDMVGGSISAYTLADGTTLKWVGSGSGNYPTGMLVSNRGIGILIEKNIPGSGLTSSARVCAYNLAVIEQSSIQDCSASNQVATINYDQFETSIYQDQVVSVIRPDGSQYNFEYQRVNGVVHGYVFNTAGQPDGPKTRYHLSCIKEPGQSQCLIQNTYQECDGPEYSQAQQPIDTGWSGSRDRVIGQNFADGRQVTYSYLPVEEPCRAATSVTMNESGSSTVINLDDAGAVGQRQYVVSSVRDPLSRVTSIDRTGENPAAHYSTRRNDLIASVTLPEGNKEEYDYDGRGNVTEKRIVPKSGSQNIVTSATYPPTCTNFKTCNKPTSVTDANVNTSIFTYSPDHGGVLTQVGPVVNGVSPAKKYGYVQRYAWVKNGSGYAQASTPVWLLESERTCNTSALNLSNGTCAAGSPDAVITTYDYGPDSGPNNLWLTGVAVTADGQTLRTCYTYDEFGRQISKTEPKANIASCPQTIGVASPPSPPPPPLPPFPDPPPPPDDFCNNGGSGPCL